MSVIPAGERDSAGGAVSLWVLLMVPVLALAGVAAIAVPQRMTAEATVNDTAENLATLAVAWREGSGVEMRALDAFPPDCVSVNEAFRAVRCREIWQPILTDLGGAGVDVGSVGGFYSDSYTTSLRTDGPPCRIYGSTLVLDAAHVALVADWYGDWAASQIWPDGVRLGAEAVGRLGVAFVDLTGYPVPSASKGNECGERLGVRNDYGEAGWLRDADFAGREMAESVSFRTPFGRLRSPPGAVGP